MRARLGLNHRGIVGQFEIVFAVVQAQHQLLDGLFGLFDLARIGRGNGHVFGVVGTEQSDTGGRVGHGNPVVAVGVAGAGAFFCEHTDDLKGHVFDQDILADGVGDILEQLAAHLVADHRDRCGVALIGLGEVTALDHRPVEDRRKVGVIAADVAQVIEIAEAHPGFGAVDRHDPHDLRQAGQRRDVIQGHDTRRRARVGSGAAEVNDVRAERAHLRHDLTLAAFADRQHHHHRGDADDDPQQRQGGAEAVDPHHPPGCVYGIHQFTFPGTGGLAAFAQPLAQIHRLQRTGIGRGLRGGVVAGAVADDQAVTDLDHAFGPRRHVAVVGDEDHHVALACQFVEQCHDLGAAVAVEGAGGFVGEDDVTAIH